MAQITYSEYVQLRKGEPPAPDNHAGGVRVYADEDGALHTLQSDGTDAEVGSGGGGALPDPITDAVTIDASALAGKVFRIILPFDEEMFVNADANALVFKSPDGSSHFNAADDHVKMGASEFISAGLDVLDSRARAVLTSGDKFQVVDESLNVLLEVRHDGSVHIKSGTTIQADL